MTLVIEPIKQTQLPSGIAYGFHEFPKSSQDGRFFKKEFIGMTMALIPRRDWDEVHEGTHLTSLFGHSYVKGDDPIHLSGGKHGYLHIGILLEKLEFKFHQLPVPGCIRCGSDKISRTPVAFVPGAGNVELPFLEMVNCTDCSMWWEDPYTNKTQKALPAAGAWDQFHDEDEYLAWGGHSMM